MTAKYKDKHNMFWYRIKKGEFDSDAMDNLFNLKLENGSPRRDAHKIYFVLCVIRDYITSKMCDDVVTNNHEFELNLTTLKRRCHLTVTVLLQYIKINSIFGVEVLQECNNSVTIRYPNFIESFNLQPQNKKQKQKRKDTDLHLETEKILSSPLPHNGANSSSNQVSSIPEENKGEPLNLVGFKKSVKLVKTETGYRWESNQSNNKELMLKALCGDFPYLDEESVYKEIQGITDNLLKKESIDISKYGYSYLFNCIKQSKNKKES